MTVENTLFTKRASHSHLWVWSIKTSSQNAGQRKFLKDIQVLPSEECITQHKPLVYGFEIRKGKDTGRKFVPKRKMHERINTSEEYSKFYIRDQLLIRILEKHYKIIYTCTILARQGSLTRFFLIQQFSSLALINIENSFQA